MATSKPRTKFLTVRLTEQAHRAFGVKTKAYGGTSFVIRELVEAFLEDRLTVKPNPTKRSLYK